MRKLIILILLVLIPHTAMAGPDVIEAGDKEIGAFLTYFTTVGGDSDFSSGYINVRFGYYVQANWLVGIAPGVTITTVDGDEETDFSTELFTKYNFSVQKQAIPYVKASVYQQKFDADDGADFQDYTYIQVGAGLNVFFTEHLSLDSSINYGRNVFADDSDGMVMIFSGISYVF